VLINMAIDTGYGYICGKSSVKPEGIIFPNYIEKVYEQQALEDIRPNIETIDIDNMLVRFKDDYYLVGKSVFLVNLKPQRNIEINGRVGSKIHLIQLLTSMILLNPNSNNFKVHLVVGLPNVLRKDMAKCEEWLKDKFEIEVITKNDITKYEIEVVNCTCMPQAYAPIYTINEEQRKQTIMSIDIGHNTTDILLINNLKTIADEKLIAKLRGVEFCYQELAGILDKRYRNLDIVDLQNAIEYGKFSYYGDMIDVTKELKYVFTKFTDYLINEINTIYDSYFSKIFAVYVNGGILNNNMFRTIFAQEVKRLNNNKPVATYTNPQLAIVDGMFEYAKRYFKDDFNQRRE